MLYILHNNILLKFINQQFANLLHHYCASNINLCHQHAVVVALQSNTMRLHCHCLSINRNGDAGYRCIHLPAHTIADIQHMRCWQWWKGNSTDNNCRCGMRQAGENSCYWLLFIAHATASNCCDYAQDLLCFTVSFKLFACAFAYMCVRVCVRQWLLESLACMSDAILLPHNCISTKCHKKLI